MDAPQVRLVELRVGDLDDLSVRSFSLRTELQEPFEARLQVRTPREDHDLDALIGVDARLTFRTGTTDAQTFGGVVTAIDLIGVETRGLCTYELVMGPRLALLAHVSRCSVFQHLNAVEIATSILDEWKIAYALRLQREGFPALEIRVQYGESDLAFLQRILEEAGVTLFIDGFDREHTVVVLAAEPQAAERLHEAPIHFLDQPQGARVATVHRRNATSALGTHVRDVAVRRHIAPGKARVRDYDFERPELELFGEASEGDGRQPAGPERSLEHYAYQAGSFGIEHGTHSVARADETFGAQQALRKLTAMRGGRRTVSFATDVFDLWPGSVLAIADHPHPLLGPLGANRPLLVTRVVFSGTIEGEWETRASAVLADEPHRPEERTTKPRIVGLQSATVVGPAGEEIHTDAQGRVKVRFHWDRGPTRGGDTSCWTRVSQGWAGAGYGFFALPRVGHEVIVAFLDGDPDQPLVVGRLHNAMSRLPYDLPAAAAVSTWRSDSTPGSGGYNEIRFDDAKGAEEVYVQAERDFDKVVKNDEHEATGRDRTISVAQNRRTSIGAEDETLVGARHVVAMAGGAAGSSSTRIEMTEGRIVLTTGDASITLAGPTIELMAKGTITVKSTDDDVWVEGGPWVKINCGADGDVDGDTFTMHHITGILRDQDDEPLAGRRLIVKDAEGKAQVVSTDGAGRYYALVVPGACEVTLAEGLPFGSHGPSLDEMNELAEVFEDCGPAV